MTVILLVLAYFLCGVLTLWVGLHFDEDFTDPATAGMAVFLWPSIIFLAILAGVGTLALRAVRKVSHGL